MSLNRDNAASYALKYATNPNPDYPNWGDDDCTNFVSQCWAAADILTSLYWYCQTKLIYADAWVDVEKFATYMTENGYAYISYDSNDAQKGDVIQLYNAVDGWHHSIIINRIDENGIIHYCGHSNSREDKPLSDIYPASGESIRFVCAYDPAF